MLRQGGAGVPPALYWSFGLLVVGHPPDADPGRTTRATTHQGSAGLSRCACPILTVPSVALSSKLARGLLSFPPTYACGDEPCGRQERFSNTDWVFREMGAAGRVYIPGRSLPCVHRMGGKKLVRIVSGSWHAGCFLTLSPIGGTPCSLPGTRITTTNHHL